MGVLKKGSGGIQEARETVARYDEQSPLYGFVQYRRRKVLLKYVPEGTSRLLQGASSIGAEQKRTLRANNRSKARLAVHFQSITERFSPHDTVFSFTTSAELADSALSAACSLHTAPASIKSASSLRRKGLAEITEDASENQVVAQANGGGEEESVVSPSAKSSLTRLDMQDETPTSPSSSAQTISAHSSSTIRKNSDKALPPIPKSIESEELPEINRDRKEEPTRLSLEGRRSSSSARPRTSEGYDRYDANGYKLKVKVGPRPSLDSPDPGSGGSNRRPISSLPASVRMPLRKAVPARNSPQAIKSSVQQTMPILAPAKTSSFPLMSPPLAQPIPSPPTPMPIRSRTAESKPSTMTPEKRRLRKAVELRQRQLAAQTSEQGLGLKGIPTQSHETPPAKPSSEDHDLQSPDDPSAGESLEILQTAMGEDESGVIRLGGVEPRNEAPTTVDASPISMPEISEGPSTQASSVSEEECSLQQKEAEEQTTVETTSFSEEEGTPKSKRRSEVLLSEISYQTGRSKDTEPNMLEVEQKHRDAATEGLDKADSREGSTGIAQRDQSQLQPAELEPKPTPSEETVARRWESGDISDANSALNDEYRSPNADVDMSVVLPNFSDNSTQNSHTSSSSKSLSYGTEAVKPQEVPLPPISEDEEIRLSPQRPSLANEPTSQSITYAGSRFQRATQVTRYSREDDEHSINTRPMTVIGLSTTDTVGDHRSVRPNRRHGLFEPIRRVSTEENSDDQFLSDDSFIEELKSATVQEAKPIRVSKSPITPEFPRPPSEHKAELVTNPRSVSSPIDTSNVEGRKTPSPQTSTLLAPRAVSVSQPRSASPSEISPPMLKKLGVSSGISQRIKALETLSSRPTSPSQTLHSPANPPPAFASLGSRNSSLRSRPGTSERPASRQSMSPTPAFDLTSPKLITPKPYNQFVSVSATSKPGKSRPESISVTAKIVRDDRNQTPEVPLDVSEPRAMELHHSPLKVEHRTSESLPPPSKKPSIKRHTTAPSISSTSTDYKRESFFTSRRGSIQSASNGSRRGSDVALSRSASEISLSGVSPDGRTEEKKESRKSRLLKRMSNISAASRRSIATALSPAPARQQPIAEQPEPVQQAPTAAVDMGDVNIQFPDTLVSKSKDPIKNCAKNFPALETSAHDHQPPRHPHPLAFQTRQRKPVPFSFLSPILRENAP